MNNPSPKCQRIDNIEVQGFNQEKIKNPKTKRVKIDFLGHLQGYWVTYLTNEENEFKTLLNSWDICFKELQRKSRMKTFKRVKMTSKTATDTCSFVYFHPISNLSILFEFYYFSFIYYYYY